ncbi:NADH dehydrogenase subunit E [Alkalithermobacter thermoalcaliphilus JW-YL-7 = DSM 7308]|uniref:NADH dehydrogenase (Quinone) n=1 Tax=Alkalithermobacter thermoalcaliphilus JW-YL-7 = DSM 7308 TaxID=1121328 RepID=A0A150FRY2_CLOPD|nr:NADH dehydrogenase (quinone) [[Clostridium] paradoxum JW-YL-7 = DSM 7308]SHK35466.1 NADH dehydrogenase subunit E [[Clostridium] paradoxum JW-YL-7 = DSM 7308]
MKDFKNKSLESKFKELEDFIDSLEDKKAELIIVLHKAQEIFGYIPREVQQFVAQKLGVHTSKVYGVVSFYSFFNMTPQGQYPISICMGTACYVRDSEKILDEFKKILGITIGEVTDDGKFSINVLRCVGACGLAPVVMIGEKVYGRVTPDKVSKIIQECE